MQSVHAYYQPVLSLADGRTVGHEVLGRQWMNDRLLSLGAFFASREISTEQKLEVDRRLRREALDKAVHENYGGLLFLNIKPEWILNFPEGRYPTIMFVEEAGLNPAQIVIEITEDLFAGEIRDLYRKIRLYRDAGFKIAIDDFQFHHVDRLLELRPDIVKVDRALVADLSLKHDTGHFIEYISSFAADSGITVLFEGVETETELEAAYRAGAELVQGFLFSQATEQFLADDPAFAARMLPARKAVFESLRERLLFSIEMEKRMDALLESLLSRVPLATESDADRLDLFLRSLFTELPVDCFRLYVCDAAGVQLSSNVEVNEAGIRLRPEFRGRNWSFRPYFLENMLRMIEYGRGIISRPYIDQGSRQKIRTFTRPLDSRRFIFVDFHVGAIR
ncbi:MAG: EAL domain-containing protein [Leptonema illini]|uniref:EAL domain-containing protein n=1 Tax=Leptonema illini TaxID=183 RepID=A0A833H3F7_9LEPT|nr:MAG: EAL domain-containing protein [Leptonema illini]